MKTTDWLDVANSVAGRFGLKVERAVAGQPSQGASARAAPDRYSGSDEQFMRLQREKWKTVPFSQDYRASSEALLKLDDEALYAEWHRVAMDTSTNVPFNYMRGWYQLLYRDYCRGRKMIDIGCGLGIDGIYFAQNGSHVTFVDIIPSNIELVRRICRYLGIEGACRFLVLNDVSDLDALDSDYDAVMGFGSLMNAPITIMKPEFDALVRRLKPEGSRFVMHAYPKSRWEREGALPFTEWGVVTDGENTPWVEWYEAPKLIEALKPARFELLFSTQYRSGDMNCIDLIRVGTPAQKLRPGAARIEGGASLDDFRTYPHWEGALVQVDGGGARISTGSQCWSYAAEAPVKGVSAGKDRPVTLLVKAKAIRGEVGIGVVAENSDDFLAELHFSPLSLDDAQLIEVPGGSSIAKIVVRNRDRDHNPSEVLIEEISFYGA